VAESREYVDTGKVGLVAKPSTPRERARRLRNEETEAERFLWARLRARQLSGAKFRRQCPIGPFIADFCCLEHRLIVELDGGQHASEVKKDEARTDFLRKEGYEAFWDHEVGDRACIAKDCGLAGGARRRMKKLNVMRWSGYAAHD